MTEQDIMDSQLYYEALSLFVHEATPSSARLSCGGVIEACLAVAKDQVGKSFAIVRPPGHHAEPDEHMGFCFFNNVAVAARMVQLRTERRKILILDW
jgi:histone deacetylase 6